MERTAVSCSSPDFPASQLCWDLIQWFKPTDHWGPLDKVSGRLVAVLDHFRWTVGVPLLLTPVGEGAAYASRGHAPHSWHYIVPGRNEYARAVDVFPAYDFWRVAKAALAYPRWRGVGIYPHAHYGKIKGMLHLDIRTTDWICWWRTKKGEYRYFDTPQALLDDIFDGLEKGL